MLYCVKSICQKSEENHYHKVLLNSNTWPALKPGEILVQKSTKICFQQPLLSAPALQTNLHRYLIKVISIIYHTCRDFPKLINWYWIEKSKC